MGNAKGAEGAWRTHVEGPVIILGRYLCEHVCFSVVQLSCLCPKDPKTKTLDAVSPERVLAGNQGFANACRVPATLPTLLHLIPTPYREAGVVIHIYRRGSGRLCIWQRDKPGIKPCFEPQNFFMLDCTQHGGGQVT